MKQDLKKELNNLYAIIRSMNFAYRIRHNGRIKFRIPKRLRREVFKRVRIK